MKEGTKYHPLYLHLHRLNAEENRLTFKEIETLLGVRLPNSARTHRAWWSNRGRGSVQAKAWMGAGYHVVNIDLEAQQITFRKPGLVYNVRREGKIVLWDADLVKALRHHMQMSQAELAEELGVRQPTISEWETSAYIPKRSTSKLLTMVAKEAGFEYKVDVKESSRD